MVKTYEGTQGDDYKAASKTLGITWESWWMYGFDGNDTLIGGNDDDVLSGGTGIDHLEGRDGDDLYSVDETGDRVIETSGNGLDIVYSSASSYTLSDHVENLKMYDGNISPTAFEGYGNSLNNKIWGNKNDNRLHGWGGDDTIEGLSGHDQIFGGTGADQLYGGDGNDTIKSYNDTNSSYGDDTSQWYVGVDDLFGGKGNDYLVAGNGNDNLYGDRDASYQEIGSGNDTLVSGTDSISDGLLGGQGNDTYIFRGAAWTFEDSGAGTDTVRIEYAYPGTYTLGNNIENLELIGNVYSGNGNNLDNVIKGNALNNTLSGQEGSDTLVGNAGLDTLYGGNGVDNLQGGDHSDVLYGGGQGDLLVGGAGDDKLVGYGWTVDEIDTLIGNSGADRFVIGDLNDAYYLANGNSYAVIHDFNRADGDKIQIYGNGQRNYTIGTGYFSNAGSSTTADAFIQYNGDIVAVIADNTSITTADFVV